jgi:bloom syndrome protein
VRGLSLSSRLLVYLHFPVYHFEDAMRLMNQIKHDRKSDMPLLEEDEKRLMEGVCQVMDYCMNISQCRRVQVLQHLDEVFRERDCHKHCDVCMDDIQVTTRDVTTEAIGVVHLVRLMLSKTTMKHCRDVFLGSKKNRVKEKHHDELPGHGKGRGMGQVMVDQLFGRLVATQVLDEKRILNRTGFFNYYLQVTGYPVVICHYLTATALHLQLGPRANELLMRKMSVSIYVKAAGPSMRSTCNTLSKRNHHSGSRKEKRRAMTPHQASDISQHSSSDDGHRIFDKLCDDDDEQMNISGLNPATAQQVPSSPDLLTSRAIEFTRVYAAGPDPSIPMCDRLLTKFNDLRQKVGPDVFPM